MDIITIKEAKEKGLNKYYTGKPCKHGHYSERKISDNGCIECAIIYGKNITIKRRQKKEEELLKFKNQYFNETGKIIITRLEAKNQGLPHYYTGKLCKNGHDYEKYTSTGSCIKCAADNRNKWIINNPEEYKIMTRKISLQWRLKHPEQAKENSIISHKNWVAADPERAKRIHRISSIKYIRKNPHKIAKSSRFYLWLRENATPKWYEEELIKELYLKRDELSKLWGIKLHVDHIIPLQSELVCGLHCWDNLQLLEASLNQSKSNKFIDDI